MDLDTFRELLAHPGQSALQLAASFAPTPASFPACVDRVRKVYPAGLAKAAVEMVLFREKARTKFPDADRLYFTRESLEQSSGHTIAAYRARRFTPYESVADLGCGIGGDTLALAAATRRVIAIEQAELLAAMAQANAAARGLADRVEVTPGDALTLPLGGVQAAFADPGRRSGDKRFLALADYLPPPGELHRRFPANFPLAFKVAPGLARRELDHWDAEAEFLSVDGELKECLLWCGPLRTAERRATLLSTMTGDAATFTGDPLVEPRPPSRPGEYVFDPAAALIRAELEHDFAEQQDLQPVDDGVAFFTSSNATPTPFGDWYRVEHSAAFHLPRLREYLRANRVGRVTMLKRASSLDVNEVMRKLKLEGPEHRHVILTRCQGTPWAIVGQAHVASP